MDVPSEARITNSRLRAPISAARRESFAIWPIRLAICSGAFVSTKNPLSPFCTNSICPPLFVTMTGSPEAIASKTTSPNLLRMMEARKCQHSDSDLGSNEKGSRRSWCSLQIVSGYVLFQRCARSGPSPTITKQIRGIRGSGSRPQPIGHRRCS